MSELIIVEKSNSCDNKNSIVVQAVAGSPKIGVFWYTDEYKMLWYEAHGLNENFISHYAIWPQAQEELIKKYGEEYSNDNYNTNKRGRVEYNEEDGIFKVWSSEPCVDDVCTNTKFVDLVKGTYYLNNVNVKWVCGDHYKVDKNGNGGLLW